MKKIQRRGPSPSVPIDTLADRAAEALRQERYKEAVELYKLVIRQDPRPDWKQALADAYAGRARALAAKGMFKEAAMVLENTLAPDGTLRDPFLYLKCLIREGQQQQKVASYVLRHIGGAPTLPATEQAALEELSAALLVAAPQRPETAGAAPPERTRWLEFASAARDALAVWVNGAPVEEIDRHLNRISLRSAFRPVRLLLKSLITEPRDDERTRRLLETIPPGSPFFPFRQAVEAAVIAEPPLDASGWTRLTAPQRAFVAETRGLPAEAAEFLARSSDAARIGPGALFAFLLKQTGLPQADVKSACLNLLPQIPDRVTQFEKSFGPLPRPEQCRIQALAAEARGDWEKAERSWRAAAGAINAEGGKQAGLSRGVIFRHLARLAAEHPEIEGDGDSFLDDPVAFYLKRSREADPDHIPAVLELIRLYREDDEQSDWHKVVDEAIQRFPDDSQILLQATESAVARKAYKKAAGFARRLLKIDPINAGVRRQMIELQVAHARKQVRSKRPDLAAKELAGAAEWDRPDAPSAVLRIARALVSLQTGQDEQAEAWLREGVELAGGGVVGWFRAALEVELMKSGAHARMSKELASARQTPPTKDAVMTIVAALGRPEAAENKRAVAGLLLAMHAWLLQAAAFEWSAAEFQALAEMFARFDAFDLLRDYTRAARRRDPTEPILRFHEIVARTWGDSNWLSMSEMDDLQQMADAAAERRDFHTANRVQRFVTGEDGPRPRRRGRAAAVLDDQDEGEAADMVASLLAELIGKKGDRIRGLIADSGRQGAAAQLINEIRSSPMGRSIPEPMLRELFEAMVEAAVEDGPRPRRPAARQVFF